MTQLHSGALFMNMASASELLAFMNVAPDFSFFMAPDPAPVSRRFYMLIL